MADTRYTIGYPGISAMWVLSVRSVKGMLSSTPIRLGGSVTVEGRRSGESPADFGVDVAVVV